MKILIVEDEQAAARRLKNVILSIDPTVSIMNTIDSVEDAIEFLSGGNIPDLIFADIQLSDGICFEIFRKVRPRSAVIFTTAYDEYALEAFKVNSIDYLLKPINESDLKRSLEKYNAMKTTFGGANEDRLSDLLKRLDHGEKSYKSRFLVKSGNSLKPVSSQDIAYFTIDSQLVFLVDRNGKRYLVESSLDDIEKLVDPGDFFRINRQMIVSLTSVKSIHSYFNSRLKLDLVPEYADDVIVSRMKVGDFKNWLEK
jgi:DNA-binding LytR/AlgR family response regulator